MLTLTQLSRTALLAIALGAANVAMPSSVAAQQFDVRGVVVDSAHAPLSDAMVVALTRKDSVIAAFSTSGGSGAYVLRRLVPGDYILQVTRIGSKPFRRNFTLGAANFTADTVVMLGAGPITLSDLVVNAEHIPIVNKPDTLEFNAEAFKTRVNATVEELLKILPGVTVGSDGSITAQGKTVQKVLVDGKEFFGNDPKMATRNLPAAAVDKVQVLEKKSDAAEFSGIDDGQEQTTVNLVLKPNARVGYFGRTVLGGGPAPKTDAAFAGSKGDDLRYTGALNLNRFSPVTQLSLVSNRNNVGQSGFSFGNEVMIGRGSGGGGSGSGFSETMAIGLNGSRQFAKNSWLRGSYFLSTSDNRQQSFTDDQLLQGAAVSANRNETATTQSDNTSHRINLNAQHAFNDWNQLRFRGNFNAGSNGSTNNSQQETRRLDGSLQNSATSLVATDANNLNGDGRFTFSKRFNQAGRTLVAEAWGDLSSPDQLSNLTSTTLLSNGQGGTTTRDILQSQLRDSRTFTTGQRLGLTEPLGKGKSLELFGQHRAISEDQTYDVNDLGSGTPVLNTDLSRAFDRTYSYLQGGTRFASSSAAIRWVLGLEVQSSDLQGKIIGRSDSINNGFTNVLPSANLRYQVNQGSNVSVNYRTSTRDPSLSELQPFVDNTDPLRTYAGNPNLTPEYQHNLRADFRQFDQFTFRSIYLYANVGYNRNQIVQSRLVDLQGRQSVMPINLGDGWNSNVGANYGTPIRSIGAQVDVDYSFSRSTGQELVNDVTNESRNSSHNIGVRLQNRDKEIFDLNAGARWGFNKVAYSINSALDQSYVNSTYYGSGTWFLTETLSASANANYQVYDQSLFGPRDNILMLGASVGQKMLDNRAEISLVGVDLLNENNGISISSSSSYIRQRQSPTLGRRVMVQFSYQLGSNLAPRGGGGRRRG